MLVYQRVSQFYNYTLKHISDTSTTISWWFISLRFIRYIPLWRQNPRILVKLSILDGFIAIFLVVNSVNSEFVFMVTPQALMVKPFNPSRWTFVSDRGARLPLAPKNVSRFKQELDTFSLRRESLKIEKWIVDTVRGLIYLIYYRLIVEIHIDPAKYRPCL